MSHTITLKKEVPQVLQIPPLVNEIFLTEGFNQDKEYRLKENSNGSSSAFQHPDISSFFMDHLFRNLKTNVDTLLNLQGTAREFFECFIQEQVDIGWRKCSHPRFVGLPGTNLLLKLAMELRNLEQGNLNLYKEVASALLTLNIWVELKFKIDEELDDKLVITGYLFIKDNSSIFKTTLDVFVPKGVNRFVQLMFIANEMVNAALKIFTNLLSTTASQLSEHEAMPEPTLPNFKHPDFFNDK